MKNHLSVIVLLLGLFIAGCNEEDDNKALKVTNFSMQINKEIFNPKVEYSTVKDGSTVISTDAGDIQDTGKTVYLTICGNEIGSYYQHFDHRTGVSTTECRLVIKVNDKNTANVAYFMSYEGKVKITDIDRENKTISGLFRFKTRNVNSEYLEVTEGIFTNLKYE